MQPSRCGLPWQLALALLVLLLTSVGVAAKEGNDRSILSSWHGTWVGQLENFPVRDGAPEIEVRLIIGPGEAQDESCIEWHSDYLQEEQIVQSKDYRVCRRKDGTFFMDEGGGLELETAVFGDTVWSVFSVEGVLLVNRQSIENDTMLQEIIFASAQGREVSNAKTFNIRGLQKIEYQRRPAVQR